MKGTFDADAFYAALDAQRRALEMTWKQVAEEAGVNASTLSRMSKDKRPDADGLALLLAWSGLQAQAFVRNGPVEPRAPESLAQITAVLRADHSLSKESAAAIEHILKAAYDRFKE